MKEHYSIYEAKARLSEIIRQVKRRRSVTITERGKEVARVVPIEPATTTEAMIAELMEAGILTPAAAPPTAIVAVARRPGALARFLRDRD